MYGRVRVKDGWAAHIEADGTDLCKTSQSFCSSGRNLPVYIIFRTPMLILLVTSPPSCLHFESGHTTSKYATHAMHVIMLPTEFRRHFQLLLVKEIPWYASKSEEWIKVVDKGNKKRKKKFTWKDWYVLFFLRLSQICNPTWLSPRKKSWLSALLFPQVGDFR